MIRIEDGLPAAPVGTTSPDWMLTQPALPAPPGADTTMTTSSPDQIWYLVVAVTCLVIPALFLGLRVYTKRAIVGMLEPADYFIFLASPFLLVEVIMGHFMVKWGAGVHQWQVTVDQLFNQLYWTNAAEIIYNPLSFLVKMAILLQYIRLFAPQRRVHKLMWYGSWATILCMFFFYLIFMFWTAFYCHPREAIWNKLIPNATCHDHTQIVVTQGVFNMVTDIVILFLPTMSLWELQVPTKKKVLITSLFATGLLACAASVMRIVYTAKIQNIYTSTDVSHNGLFIGLWTEAEVALGFIVACSLSLPRLIQANRKHVSKAIFYISHPFTTHGYAQHRMGSTMDSTPDLTSMHPLKTKNSGYDTIRSRDSKSKWSMQDLRSIRSPIGPPPPVFYEDRVMHAQQQAGIYPIREVPDPYRLPSRSGSSVYSQPTRAPTEYTRANSTRSARTMLYEPTIQTAQYARSMRAMVRAPSYSPPRSEFAFEPVKWKRESWYDDSPDPDDETRDPSNSFDNDRQTLTRPERAVSAIRSPLTRSIYISAPPSRAASRVSRSNSRKVTSPPPLTRSNTKASRMTRMSMNGDIFAALNWRPESDELHLLDLDELDRKDEERARDRETLRTLIGEETDWKKEKMDQWRGNRIDE